MIDTKAVELSVLGECTRIEALAVLSRFRMDFHACLTARADELFEFTDALLCTDGPMKTLVDLALAPEHRRGHGALYNGVNHGEVDLARLRRTVAGLPLPCSADGRLMLAVDVRPWLRADAPTSGQRLFCPPTAGGRGRRSWSRVGRTPSWPRWNRDVARGRRCWMRSASARKTPPPRSPPASSVMSSST